VDENIIDKIKNLSTKGKKFNRDKKFMKKKVLKFPKIDEERRKLEKRIKSYHNITNFKSILEEVLKVIMEYITLDGHFTRVFNHHFVLLNKFGHNNIVSIPQYLLSYIFSVQ
jgi:hypothetical protein